MSLPAINLEGLPVLRTWMRRTIYTVYVLAWAFISSVDDYYDDADPFWIDGAWRVLINLSVFVSAFALLNARQTPVEQRVTAVKEQRKAIEEQQHNGPLGT